MVLLGNILSFVGCALMVIIGFVKKKKHMMTAQCFQFGFLALGNLALGAKAGFISGVVNVVRNLVFFRVDQTVWLKIGFIAVQGVLTAFTARGGMIEWLPWMASVVFIWFLDTKSAAKFKASIMAGQALWMIYDWNYRNFVSFTFDILTILSNLAGILMLRREAK